MNAPDFNTLFPIEGYNRLCFLKNHVQNPNIIVGAYTYYDDFESVDNFEKNVKYHFDFLEDRLIIGKFCMIASGASFIMNGANHLTTGISAYPFSVFGGAWAGAMKEQSFPHKGDTVVGHDVWIGHQATLMPGVQVGSGAIIASCAVVTKDVPPYAIVGGNPAQIIRFRFSEDQIKKLLQLSWWNWELDKITQHVELLSTGAVDELFKL